MARLTGPDEASRTVFLVGGANKGKALAQGMPVPIYSDQALTTLADILTTTGDPVAESTIIVDAYSRIPLFQFPDGVDTVWTSINGGPAVPLYARTDDRLDSLATRVTSLESGGASDALVVHKAGAETITGVKTFSVSPIVPTPTAAGEPATKLYTDTADALLTPLSRTISTTAPLTGGGDLTANRTLAVSNATGSTVGVVQLAGDLTGTATAPTIATGAVTSAKIADGTIVDGDISGSAGIAQAKVSGLATDLASLRWYINATDPAYGLSTAGTTAANTTALTAAMTAANTAGKPVYIPPGTYEHNAMSITAPLVGAGMTRTILHGPQLTLSTSNVTLQDLRIVSSDPTAVVSARCADVRWIRVQTSHDVGVTNHLAWDAFDVDRMRVLDCKFGIGGLQLSGCDDFVIHGNWWDAQYANTNEPCQISGQSSGVFTSNTVTNTATDAVDCYSSGHRVVIANNRFIGLQGAAGLECKVTMSDIPGNSSGPDNKFESTVIANNVFYDFNSDVTSTRTGIFAVYVDSRATPAFSVAETNAGIIITGNVLEGFNTVDPGNGAIVSYQGIVYTGHNGLVADNTIRRMRAWNSAAPVGILLANDAAGVVNLVKNVRTRVSGNVIVGVEGTVGTGIRTGNLDYCQITGNIVGTDEETGVTTKLGIDFAQGATLNQCDISGNMLNCNNAAGFGIRSATTTVTLTECRVSGNVMRDCGMSITKAVRTGFVDNTLVNATNGQGFTLGNSGTSSTDCQIIGNRITMGGSSAGIVMTNMDGFIADGNVFKTTTRPIYAFNATKNGIVSNNISRTQGVGTSVLIFDATVSGGDQATTYVDLNSNKILT